VSIYEGLIAFVINPILFHKALEVEEKKKGISGDGG
jgi:hypothetical protein